MGAAMLAAYGCGWFVSLQDCADEFLKEDKVFEPNQENVEKYKQLFPIYQEVYGQTKDMNEKLLEFRK
jgi:xylulokinase